MAHAVGAVVAEREAHEGGGSPGDSVSLHLLQRRVGIGAAAERRLDGRDRRLRLLALVHEPEQLRGRLAVPELARVGAAPVPPRLVEARQVGAAGLVVISTGCTQCTTDNVIIIHPSYRVFRDPRYGASLIILLPMWTLCQPCPENATIV